MLEIAIRKWDQKLKFPLISEKNEVDISKKSAYYDGTDPDGLKICQIAYTLS